MVSTTKAFLRPLMLLCVGLILTLLAFSMPVFAQTRHTVRAGENLSEIANRYGTTIAHLTNLNNISNPNHIVVGQRLILPNIESANQSQTPTLTHTIVAGENLFKIASRYGTTIAHLTNLNNISNPNHIVVGQRLILPNSSIVKRTYIVQSGDTLWSIAGRLNTSVGALVQANGIVNPTTLQVGAVLSYSGISRAGVSDTFRYRIKSGDTISSLANKFETTSSKIIKLNNFSPDSVLRAKTLITIPSPPIVYTIHHWAVQYGVPPDLLKALTWWESGWDNSLVSSANAIGIGQLIPSTVSFVSEALIGRRLNPYIPEQNVQMSARFMAYLLAQTNYESNYALGAYYQGLGAVRRYGIYNSSWRYIKGIQALRAQFP